MAKISLRVFKQGKPIYWIIGAVVLFVVFYIMFNRGGSSGSTAVVSSGPSEALQAAQLQAATSIQGAQIAANIEAARIAGDERTAQLGAQVAIAQLMSGEHVALATLEFQKQAAVLNAQTNLLINEQNLTYGVETARLAAETQVALRNIDVGLLEKQIDVQSHMFEVQSQNLIYQSLIGQVSNLKKKNRDEALAYLTSNISGTPYTYVGQTGGGGFLGDVVHVLSPISNAIM